MCFQKVAGEKDRLTASQGTPEGYEMTSQSLRRKHELGRRRDYWIEPALPHLRDA